MGTISTALAPLTVHRGHGALEADDISKGSSDHSGLNDGSHDNVHVVHESLGVTVPDLQTSGISGDETNRRELAWILDQHITDTLSRYSQLMHQADTRCLHPVDYPDRNS